MQKIINSSNNVFNYIALFALLITQIFSAVFYVPGLEGFGISYFRVFIFILGIIFLFKYGFKIDVPIVKTIFFIGLLTAFMGISLLWTPDKIEGLRQISYYISIAFIMYCLFFLCENNYDKEKILKITFILGMFILLFAIYELQTGFHLNSQILDRVANDPSQEYILEGQAWAMFGNPNDLAVHLALACISGFWLAINSGKITMIVASIFVLCVMYVLINMSTVLTAISIVLFFIVYFALKFGRFSFNIIAVFVVFVALSVIILKYDYFNQIFSNEVYFEENLSMSVRFRLLAISADMALSTVLVGIGSGGFEAYMQSSSYIQWTHFIVSPHNAFGRILAENGIIGLLILLSLVFAPMRICLKSSSLNANQRVIVASVAVMPFLLSIGSNPISSSSLQLWIAWLIVAARLEWRALIA
jgi:O-antigen ligase